MSRLILYITRLAFAHLDYESATNVFVALTRVERHVRSVWLGSYNGPLVLMAAAVSGEWFPLALAALASFSVSLSAFPRDDYRLESWVERLAIELTALTRVLSIAAVTKWAALGLMGGGGLWAYLPATAGPVLDALSVLLAAASIIALMFAAMAFIAVPLVYAAADVRRLIAR